MDQQEILAPAVKVVEYTKIEAGIAELKKRHEGVVFDVTTTDGDKAARAARQECVKLRTTLEAKRKAIKAPALQRCRDIDDEAKRITKAIETVEGPIDAQIKAEETRKEAERIERERIETKKREKVSQAISDIAFVPVYAAGKSAEQIASLVSELCAKPLTEDEFGDRLGEAGIAKSAAIAKLEELHTAAVAHEDDQRRIAADREELARIQAEQAATQARQAQEQEDLDRQRRELAAKEAPKPVAALAQAPVVAAIPATAVDQQPVETDDCTLSDFFAKLEKVEIAPGLDEMAGVIAAHYGVPPYKAREWIVSAAKGQS